MLAPMLFADDQILVVTSKKFRRNFGSCVPIFVFCWFLAPSSPVFPTPSFLLFLSMEEKLTIRPQDRRP